MGSKISDIIAFLNLSDKFKGDLSALTEDVTGNLMERAKAAIELLRKETQANPSALKNFAPLIREAIFSCKSLGAEEKLEMAMAFLPPNACNIANLVILNPQLLDNGIWATFDDIDGNETSKDGLDSRAIPLLEKHSKMGIVKWKVTGRDWHYVSALYGEIDLNVICESGLYKCNLKTKQIIPNEKIVHHPIMDPGITDSLFKDIAWEISELQPYKGQSFDKNLYYVGCDAEKNAYLIPKNSNKPLYNFIRSVSKLYQPTFEIIRKEGGIITDHDLEIQHAAAAWLENRIKESYYNNSFALSLAGTSIDVVAKLPNGKIFDKSAASGVLVEELAEQWGISKEEACTHILVTGDGLSDIKTANPVFSDETSGKIPMFFTGSRQHADFGEAISQMVIISPHAALVLNGAKGPDVLFAAYEYFAGKLKAALRKNQAFNPVNYIPPSNDPFAEFLLSNYLGNPNKLAELETLGSNLMSVEMFLRECGNDYLIFDVLPTSHVIVPRNKKYFQDEQNISWFFPSAGEARIIVTADDRQLLRTNTRTKNAPSYPLAQNLNNGFPKAVSGPNPFAELFDGTTGPREATEEDGTLIKIGSSEYLIAVPDALMQRNPKLSKETFNSALSSARYWASQASGLGNIAEKNQYLSCPSYYLEFPGHTKTIIINWPGGPQIVRKGLGVFGTTTRNFDVIDTVVMKVPTTLDELICLDCEEATKDEVVRDANGNPMLGEDGNPKKMKKSFPLDLHVALWNLNADLIPSNPLKLAALFKGGKLINTDAILDPELKNALVNPIHCPATQVVLDALSSPGRIVKFY